MKKRILFVFMFLFAGFLLVACDDTINEYSVTFNTNGGSLVEAVLVEDGSLVTKPTDPTKADYDFEGWFKTNSLDTPWIFATDKVTKDTTIYAMWKLKEEPVVEVSVTFNFNYNGSPMPQVVKVNKGEVVSKITDPTRDDFAFIGWAQSASSKDEFNFTEVITTDMTLYAIWESTLDTVSVTIDEDNGSQVEVIDAVVGELLAERQDPVKGEEVFIGWYNGDDLWDFATDLVTVEMTLTAKYSAIVQDGVRVSTPQDLIQFIINGIETEGTRYYLTNDIDMEDVLVIYENAAEFNGIFDGNNFTISNLKYHSDDSSARVGLFRTLKDATVKNLYIENANMHTQERAGILAAEVTSGVTIIENVHIYNSVISGGNKDNAAGGLIGYVNAGTDISNVSLVNVSVNANSLTVAQPKGTGGLIGRLRGKDNLTNDISDIFLDVTVNGFDHTGGLIGLAHKDTSGLTVNNAVVIANVNSDTQYITGLIGREQLEGDNVVGFSNVVAQVTLGGSASKYVGYFVGRETEGSLHTRNNVFISVDGLSIDQDNRIIASELVETADLFYDNAWWTTNQAGIVENALWEMDALGFYVLKASIGVSLDLPVYNTVTLDFGYDSITEVYKVPQGSTFKMPESPTRINFEFTGWKIGEDSYNFDLPVTSNLTINASWLSSIEGSFIATGNVGIVPESNVDFGGTLTMEFKFMVGDDVILLSSDVMESGSVKIGQEQRDLIFNVDTTLWANVLTTEVANYIFVTKEGQQYVGSLDLANVITDASLERTATEIGKLVTSDENYYMEYLVKANEATLGLTDANIKAVYQLQTNADAWVALDLTNETYNQLATASSGKLNLFIVDLLDNAYLVTHEHVVHHVVTINIEDSSQVLVVIDETILELPLLTSDERLIDAWYTSIDYIEANLFNEESLIKQKTELFAKVAAGEVVNVTITWDGLVEDIIVPVIKGELLELPELTNEGFDLEGYYTNIELTTVYDLQATVMADLTIYVKWTEIVLTEIKEVFTSDIVNPYFTIGNAGSKLKPVATVTFESSSYDESLKLDSSNSVTFTTTTTNAKVRVITSERHHKDYGDGRVKVDSVGYAAEKTLILRDDIASTDSLTGANIQVLEFDLTDAGTYVISRGNKEQMIFAVEVIEYQE